MFKAADQLRARVLMLTARARPRVLLVSGVHDPAGAVDVASLLAEELAYNGSRTLLVDGAIDAPSVALRYGVREPANAIDGEPRAATTLEWLQDPGGSHYLVTLDVSDGRSLDLVPQFRPARPAAALFAGFGEALGRWAAYDAIVVYAPPLEEGRQLLRFATGVVLVTGRGGLDRRTARRCARLVRDAGSRLLGSVEVGADNGLGSCEEDTAAASGRHPQPVVSRVTIPRARSGPTERARS